MNIKYFIPTVKIGQVYTNGELTLKIIDLDDSAVMFENGYCPNYFELFLQWKKVS